MQKEIKIFNQKIQLTMRNDGDYAIAHELFLEHQYRFCDDVISKGKNCAIDIGGHLGFFSLYAALLNANIPIYVFEPHIGNFALLKTNLKNNHIKNVYAKQLAVDKNIGQKQLQISKEDLNHSIVKAIEPTGETQIVQTITLEKIFTKNRITKCDLLKIDCEGAEFDILYSTPVAIFDKINHIFLEYHDWDEKSNSQELENFLKKMGFKTKKYPNNKMKELGFLWCVK